MPDDRYWMEQALALAALGAGTARPNPMVGSVVVRDGGMVGAGFHRRPGDDHAEVVALKAAGDLARGATLYVNLEPCIHHGRTPPCTGAILEAGVRRVVAATIDPHAEVGGRGCSALREAGVDVSVGLLQEAAEAMNAGFLKLHRTGRPAVTLKAAVSLDGRIAGLEGDSRWVSGPESRAFTHRLRWTHDAVLVGAGTVRADDPRLTARLPGLTTRNEGATVRCVLSDSLRFQAGAKLFHDHEPDAGEVLVYTASGDAGNRPGTAELVRVPGDPEGGLDLLQVLSDLASRGVQSVLVEGGATTFAAFLRRKLVDRWALFRAPVILGERGGTPLAALPASPSPAEGWWHETGRPLPLGRDSLVLASPVR